MTAKNIKIGRPKKENTGKTMFVPANLVKYVTAMIRADKGIDDSYTLPAPQGGLSDDDISAWRC